MMVEKGEREIGTLGWIFIGSVLALVVVMVLLFAPRGKEGGAPAEVAEKGEEGPARFLRVDDKVLEEWLMRAEPIGECSDGELVSNLARGAEARSRVALGFRDSDNAAKWSGKAIEAYERLAALSKPGKGNPYRRISLLHAAMGRMKEAIEYERKHIAWEEQGGEQPERMTLARLLLEAKEYDAAAKELKRVLEGGPNDLVEARAHMYMGDCLRKTGDVTGAIQAYGRAIEGARQAMERSTPEEFDRKGTYLFRPVAGEEKLSSVEWIGEPPESPRVRDLVEKRGYRIANAEMRAARIEELKILLQQVAERSAGLLHEMGTPPGATEAAASQPAPASQPATAGKPQ